MRAPWLAFLCLVASPAQARPYGVDDLLRLEGYGQVQVDPTERWAIVERRARYDSAPRFDYGAFVERSVSKLMVLDLETPGQLSPLFDQEPDAGYWSGGFSPSGRRLAVFRLQGERLSLGVLDIAARVVRWLPTAASLPRAAPAPIWVDDDTLVYAARPDGRLPNMFAGGAFSTRSARVQWSQQAEGRDPSVTVIGSGAYRDEGLQNDATGVIRVDLRTGASETLERGSISDIALSADRRQLAIVERGTALQPDPDTPIDPAALGRRQRLVLRNLETGRRRDVCPTCDILPNVLHWSPAGAQLLYFARRDGEAWADGRLYRLGDSEPQAVTLPTAHANIRVVGGSGYALNVGWAGSDPVISSNTTEGAAAWFRVGGPSPSRLGGSEAGSLIGGTRRNLYFNSAAGLRRVDGDGRATLVVDGQIRSVGVELLDPYSTGPRNIYNPNLARPPFATVVRGESVSAVQIDPASGDVDWSLQLPASDARVLAVARRRGALLYMRINRHGVGTLTLAGIGRAAIEVDAINAHLADIDISERIAIHSTAPDGTRLTHWLTLPARTGAPPPLVVIPYPGFVRPDAPPPALEGSTFRPMVNPILLVAAGYAVLEPSLPRYRREGDVAAGMVDLRPSGRLPEHDDPIGQMTRIVLDAVDAVVATGRVDGTRTALYGHSFGGWAVVSIGTRTDRFRSIVAASGPYDLLAAYGRLAPGTDLAEYGIQPLAPFGWFESGQGALGASPWRDPQTYLERSPFYSVERIHTPVMFIHGDQDVVPNSSAERMFMALYRLNREAIYLRYGGEEHSPWSPANIRDQWRRTLEFISSHMARPGTGSEAPIPSP